MNMESIFYRYRKFLELFCYIGKASFHILLVQMTYFYFARRVNVEFIFENIILRIVFDILISVMLGCLFYWINNILKNHN